MRIMNEIDSYLREKTNLSIEDGLKDYPVMRKIFEKYNCIRTSEALCERMFSYAGILYSNIYKKLCCSHGVLYLCVCIYLFYLEFIKSMEMVKGCGF